jgi:hypothetical protein
MSDVLLFVKKEYLVARVGNFQIPLAFSLFDNLLVPGGVAS